LAYIDWPRTVSTTTDRNKHFYQISIAHYMCRSIHDKLDAPSPRQRFAQWLTQSRGSCSVLFLQPSKSSHPADRVGTGILIFSTAVSSTIPAIQAYAGGQIIDSVSKGIALQ
jgi:hypothetical protein